MNVTVRAPAKINLHLGVGPRRDDGYHELATVYQAIGLYDDVTVTSADAWSVSLTTLGGIDGSEVPLDDTNIVLRAGRLLTAHHGLDRAAAIAIRKGIPVAGGLAGGSADAAATLVALDRLWDLQTSDDDLLALAAQLGSDVPFALLGGTALGTGHGELVTPLPDAGSWWWLVAPAEEGLSTARVYAELDVVRPEAPAPAVPETLARALASGDVDALAGALHNDLAAPALRLRPEIAAALDDGGLARAALLSGSGPTCLFLCADKAAVDDLRRAFDARGRVAAAAPGPVAGAHVVDYAGDV
jgi:4-diphosphocytidyl-2-C-methyl-D-erythritol kinase